jgi:hypothetical protein
MTKLRDSNAICATICTVIVLALLTGAVTYGTPHLRLLSHGPMPIPPDDGSTGDLRIAHGPMPIPPDDGSTGDFKIFHGPMPIPPDDGSTGDLV